MRNTKLLMHAVDDCKDVDIVSDPHNNSNTILMHGSFTLSMTHQHYTHQARCKAIVDETQLIECKPEIGFTTLNTTEMTASVDPPHMDSTDVDNIMSRSIR